MVNKILRMFEEVKIKNITRNEIKRKLEEIEKLVFNRNIKDNSVLNILKKDDWIVNNNNKHIIRWACKHTIDIVNASMGFDITKVREGKLEGAKNG